MTLTESQATAPARWRSRRNRRTLAIAASVAAIIALGYLISLTPGRGIDVRRIDPDLAFDILKAPHPRSVRPESAPEEPVASPTADPDQNPEEYARQVEEIRKNALFKPIATAIEAGRHEQAIEMLNHIRSSVKDHPEAYVYMGRALRGSGDHGTAMDFFLAAIERDPSLAEAYFEFGATADELGEPESALSGMRSFLHLARDRDPFRLQIAQARSAIWEIEARIGRGEWGSTRGIPPGFTADELKRDGKGVGIKIPLLETERPDGTMDYEIRTGEKQEMFRK